MKELQAKAKVTQTMTRDGLVVENQADGTVENVSSREAEQDYSTDAEGKAEKILERTEDVKDKHKAKKKVKQAAETAESEESLHGSAARLELTEDERADPELQPYIHKAEAKADKLDAARAALPKKRVPVKGKYSPRRIASEIYDTLNNYVSFIRDFPNDVSEILYKLKEGKIKHDVILDDNTLFIKTIRMVSRRIAYVIMLIGLFIGSIVLIVFDRDNGYGHFILIATSILILLQMLKWLFSRR